MVKYEPRTVSLIQYPDQYNNMSKDMETFCVGHPLDYVMKGVSELPSSSRRNSDIAEPIEKKYGIQISEETAGVIAKLHSAQDATALVDAMKQAGLDEVDDFEPLIGPELDEEEEADISRAMAVLDTSLHYGYAPRDKDASKVSSKRQRESTYVPEVVERAGDGDVYMAKTLSTTAKVRMAWDLDDENEVVVVDDYDKWENLLGWKKLKNLPHGKNKIREELGDQLSDEVLDMVAGSDTSSSDSDSDNDSTDSKGRRTRTKPSDEVLNVATSSRHRDRAKFKSEDILESLQDDGYIGSEYSPVKMLVLFPTTTDLNMSDHYWVAGDRWEGAGRVAIANCNKGTFEYLNQHDAVWHIEDYLDQADDYEFETNHGPVTMSTVDEDKLVLHAVKGDMKPRLLHRRVLSEMPEALPEYCENNILRRKRPEFPHADDMLYAPIDSEDVFWMRPELRKQQNPDDGDALLLYADSSPRDVGTIKSVSSEYKLYARARLPDWDFDSTEMKALDKCSYRLSMDEGAYEVVETLAKLHDNGMEPFSETPQSRWSS